MKNNIALIFCSYDKKRSVESLAYLKSMFTSSYFKLCICVFNSDQEASFSDYHFDEYLIHDNTDREFGALQAGLSHLRNKNPDLHVLLVNDTFGVHSPANKSIYLRLKSHIKKENRIENKFAAGCYDTSTKGEFSLGGTLFSKWIRGNFIFLSKSTLVAIDYNILQKKIIGSFLVSNSGEKIHFSDAVSQNLKAHLTEWLTGRSAGTAWYGASGGLEIAHADLSKLNSILIELNLSCMLIEKKTIEVNLAGGFRAKVIMKFKIISRQIKGWSKKILI